MQVGSAVVQVDVLFLGSFLTGKTPNFMRHEVDSPGGLLRRGTLNKMGRRQPSCTLARCRLSRLQHHAPPSRRTCRQVIWQRVDRSPGAFLGKEKRGGGGIDFYKWNPKLGTIPKSDFLDFRQPWPCAARNMDNPKNKLILAFCAREFNLETMASDADILWETFEQSNETTQPRPKIRRSNWTAAPLTQSGP